jgi:hypothetical protein
MTKRNDDWFDDLRNLPGEAGEVMRAALGQTKAELEKAFEDEARRRPGIFNNKLDRKR